jgi:hypothetical protein
MTQSQSEIGQKPNKHLGRVLYLLITLMGVILYLLIAHVLPPWSHLSPLSLNLAAGFILTGLIFFLVNQFGFNLDEKRQTGLEMTTHRLSQAVDGIERLKLVEESDLFRYKKEIRFIEEEEWYDYVEKATDHISLMSPSLHNWFTDAPRFQDLLVKQAINGTTIRFIIMGSENPVCSEIASLRRNRAEVDFYEPATLEVNQNKICRLIRDVNKEIQRQSKGEPNYLELRKVVCTPIFVKTEFFGEVLHWSFFGYDLDGKVAPSFWSRKKVDDGKSLGLYQILKNEFDLIWKSEKISQQIDVSPTSGPVDD